jgi:NAD(P)-dependent dehydrogenase (short-subunit alcohol dehydrogenase family)
VTFDGKTILITGAAGAVGQACTRLFVERGARMMLSDCIPPNRQPSDRIAFQPADVTDPAAMTVLVEATLRRFGPIDAAVLAAGIEGPVGPVEDLTTAELDRVLAVNLKGSLFALQALLPGMKSRGAGSIVALSSISGVIGSPALSAYTMSKHALIGLVRASALEVASAGVRINAVCPGPIESDMMQRLDQALTTRFPDRATATGSGLPTQRYVTADEVARMIAFLCGEDAASCTGGVHMVDGGFTAK